MRRLVVALSVISLLGCSQEQSVTEDPKNAADAGRELRKMALTTPAGQLGFAPDNDYPNVYGILTDWNLGDQTASILSMKDGTASLYTNSTRAIIGGHAHDNVRQAAERYVKLAGQYYDDSREVTDFAYPEPSQVYFYLLTYDGVRLCVGDEIGIDQGTDPTRSLFAAAQEVLTQLRLVAEMEEGIQQ